MGLAADLKTAKKGRDYKRQAVDAVLDELDAEDRAALLQSLNDRDVTATTIAKTLVEHGFLGHTADPAQAVRSWRSRNL